ncbi:protein of unknown function [Candidatus Methylomirabilis oxygeniifera]|uniref:Uncharacterized protein n=1 Tax=Methylomirabilis oxygeniifera TaxID=671143 RepID=D5MGP4_METO1|nr:protein of unknown function [Candidatus Methylomirabilis oxyfera]
MTTTGIASGQIRNRRMSVLIENLPMLRIVLSHNTIGLQRFSSAATNETSQNCRKLL